jgi:hypothetical protein
MIATLVQAAGVVAIAIGLGLIWMPLGIVAAGIGTLLFGIALERSE